MVQEGFQFLLSNDRNAFSYDKTKGKAGDRGDLDAALSAWQDDRPCPIGTTRLSVTGGKKQVSFIP